MAGSRRRGALHLPLRTTSLLRAVPELVQTGSFSDQEPKNGLIIQRKAPGGQGWSGEAMDLEWAKTGTTVFVAGLGDLEGLFER